MPRCIHTLDLVTQMFICSYARLRNTGHACFGFFDIHMKEKSFGSEPMCVDADEGSLPRFGLEDLLSVALVS